MKLTTFYLHSAYQKKTKRNMVRYKINWKPILSKGEMLYLNNWRQESRESVYTFITILYYGLAEHCGHGDGGLHDQMI